MPLYSDSVLVLRHYDLADADKIVSFFGRRYGKTRAVIKGAKKLKSRFAGRLEPFNSLDIVLYGKENSTLFKLSSVEISQPRTSFAEQLDKFYRAYYLMEMVEVSLRDGDSNPQAFDAVVKTLDWLEETNSYEWAIRFFDVRFLSALGYRPTLEKCIVCEKVWPGEGSASFDAEKGGILCRNCVKNGREYIQLSTGSVKFLTKILTTDFQKARRLKPSKNLLAEISNTIVSFRNSRLHTVFKTERFF